MFVFIMTKLLLVICPFVEACDWSLFSGAITLGVGDSRHVHMANHKGVILVNRSSVCYTTHLCQLLRRRLVHD